MHVNVCIKDEVIALCKMIDIFVIGYVTNISMKIGYTISVKQNYLHF